LKRIRPPRENDSPGTPTSEALREPERNSRQVAGSDVRLIRAAGPLQTSRISPRWADAAASTAKRSFPEKLACPIPRIGHEEKKGSLGAFPAGFFSGDRYQQSGSDVFGERHATAWPSVTEGSRERRSGGGIRRLAVGRGSALPRKRVRGAIKFDPSPMKAMKAGVLPANAGSAHKLKIQRILQ
jgi:hypothetical protein